MASSSPTHLRIHSPNVQAWEPDTRLLQSSSRWLSKYGLTKLKLTLEQILPTIGFKHSDDYVRPLKKPISARYGDGLFAKVPHKNGKVYNLVVTKDKLKLIEAQLKQAVITYKKRLEWLTSESRRIFGVVEEKSVAIILDVQAASRSQFEMYIQSLIQVVKEQIMFISKFNLIRSAEDIICWQNTTVNVTVDSIDNAISWLLKQDRMALSSPTSSAEAVVKAMSDDQVEAVYYYTEGSSSDKGRELLKRKAIEYKKPLHIVAMNCCSPSTLTTLKDIAKETKGRFHAYSMFDDDDFENTDVSSWINEKDRDSDSGTDVDYQPRRHSGHRSAAKIGFGVKEDVMLLWTELDKARDVLSYIQALIVESDNPQQVETMPVQHSESNPAISSGCGTRSELYMGSKEWLMKNGLRSKRLGFYDFLETLAFKHCDGVVDIRRAPGNHRTTDSVVRPKLVNARYCDKFAHVRWKDGRIMHVHISGPMHTNYETKMLSALESYRKRLDWLQQGSRELFGTIIEDKISILIDTSSSMASRLFIVKDKLYRLMQEQLRHKRKFNLIKFDSRVQPWRDHLVKCTDQNLENAWQWVKGLTTGGSTNTLGALKRALADTETEAVYLLSDGRPDQPPSTVIAQANLMNTVPVHTISFNCADSEANEFLSQLAAESGGRYHYFSVDGYDESGPRPFESEDLRLLREEIEQGLSDLDKIEKLREECTKLDWYGTENRCTRNHSLTNGIRKERPLSAHGASSRSLVPSPPQAQRPTSAQQTYRSRSRQTVSRTTEHTSTSQRTSPGEPAIIHTRSSELRMSLHTVSQNGWMLKESRDYLGRTQSKEDSSIEEQRKKKRKKKKKRKVPEPNATPLQRWLKKNSLAARKLTIVDALAPTMIPHSTKYVPILDKHVLSKVFDQVLPLAHASGSNRTEVQIINPQAVNLPIYEEKLEQCIEEYNGKLNTSVFQALSSDERLKYEGEDIPSFAENRSSMLSDLEDNNWPILLKDIEALEKEIKQAEMYLKQSKELRETSVKLAKESSKQLNTIQENESKEKASPKPSLRETTPSARLVSASTYRWSRNQRIIARSELDGFYYPGFVHRPLNARFLEIDFENGDRQVTPVRYVIMTGGSRPCPVLRVGDYVLTRASVPRQQGDDLLPESDVCYVPGIVQVTPLREKSALRCYTVIRFNGKKVTVIRNDMIKISRSRFILTCRYIRDAQKTTTKGEFPTVIYPSDNMLQEDNDNDNVSVASHMTARSASRRSSRMTSQATSRAQSVRSSRSRSHSTESQKSVSTHASSIDSDFMEQKPGQGATSDENEDDKSDTENKEKETSRKASSSSSDVGPDRSDLKLDLERIIQERYSEQEEKLLKTQETLQDLQRQLAEERELFKKQQAEMEEKQNLLQEKQQELVQKQIDDQQEEQKRLQREQRKLQEQQEDLLRKQKEQQEHLLQQQYNQSQALHLQKQQVLQQQAKRLMDQQTETERNLKDQMTETDKKQYRDMDTSPYASSTNLAREQKSDDEGAVDQVDSTVNGADNATKDSLPATTDEAPHMKVFLDDESEAFLLTKGSHGLLISRKPPDEDPAVSTQNIPRAIQVGEEVLARWPDDGWYYRGTIRQDGGDSSYFVEDSVGDLERIYRKDIITDDDDADNIVNIGDPVIALHPSFAYSYAPGLVLAANNSNMTVRYYDGHESIVPREEVYLISAEKFEIDCSYILGCEDSLVGQAVVARNDKDGKFHLGSVRERVSGPRNYLIEWADQSLQIQNYAYIFGAHSKRHQLTMGSPVLAIADYGAFMYLPGRIVDTNGQKLVVEFCDGSTSSQVDPMQSFWLSPDYFDRVVGFYHHLKKEQETTSR